MKVDCAQFCEVAKNVRNWAGKLAPACPHNGANLQSQHPPTGWVASDAAAFSGAQRGVHRRAVTRQERPAIIAGICGIVPTCEQALRRPSTHCT